VHGLQHNIDVRRMHAYDSPEARANVAAIEAKLAELDDAFRQFCSRQDYRFSPIVQLWPRRRVWRRQEIDRCMDLTMEIGVQDVLNRGFYPELPWSLYASGSLRPDTALDVHIFLRPVFEHVPFFALASVLVDGLERGLQILNGMTETEIRMQGQKLGRGAEPDAAPNGGPAMPLANSVVPEGPPSVS
jgi:hypothetical protein